MSINDKKRMRFVGNLLLTFCFPVYSQIMTTAHKPQIWDEGKLYTVDHQSRQDLLREGEKGQKAKITLPAHWGRTVRNGVAWFTQKDFSSEEPQFQLWKKEATGEAQLVGAITEKEAGGHIYAIYPLEKDRYLAVALIFPFLNKKETYYLFIAKANEAKKFEIEEYQDFSEPKRPHFRQFPNATGTGMQWKSVPESAFIGQMVADGLVRCGDFYLAISRGTGYIYTLSTKDGSCRRVSKLFPKVESYLAKAQEELEWPILAVQPTQEGKLLIVSRTEEAVFQARKSFPVKNFGNLGPSAHDPKVWQTDESAQYRQADSLKAFPELQYWSFDPESGEFTLLSRPEGMPDKLWDLKMAKGFAFELSYDGKWIYTGETAQAPNAPIKPKLKDPKAPGAPSKAAPSKTSDAGMDEGRLITYSKPL